MVVLFMVPHFLGLEIEPRRVYICQTSILALNYILGPFEFLLLFYIETSSVVSWLALKLLLLWSTSEVSRNTGVHT